MSSMEGLMKHLLTGAAILAAVGFSIATGCKSQTHRAPSSSGRALTLPPTTQARTHAAAPTTAPAADSPDLLARKTESYAREVEQMLAKQRQQQAEAATRPVETPTPPGKPLAVAPPSEPAAAPAAAKAPVETPPVPAQTPRTPEETAPPVANQTASLSIPPTTPPSPQPAAPHLAVPQPESQETPDIAEPSAATGDWERRVLEAAKDRPNEVAPQLNYQLLEFIKGQSVPDMRAMAALSSEDRDVLVGLLDALTNFRSGVRADNNLLQSRKIRPLLNLADRLRAQADLSLPTLTLCRRVEGFGVYDPIEPLRFMAGKEHPAIIYCEVANFSSQQSDKKMWSTKISEEEVLYTESGLPVWPARPTPRTIADQSRNRRHDFFIVKLIRLPATLSVGRYLLKVTIVDQLSNRMAEGTIPIDIVAE